MNARLLSFQYHARGSNGWMSPVLRFGSNLTAVGGDNGAGKTPIMKGVMSALGHEVALHPDILANCSRASIDLDIDGQRVLMERDLSETFQLRASDGGNVRTFSDQATFSTWFLGKLGIQQRELTTVNRTSTPIYLSTLYPLIWVDQDTGWSSLYAPPAARNFVLSQKAEMARVVLGLPPRHPFRSRDDYDKAKRRLEVVERHVATERELVERLRAGHVAAAAIETTLEERRDALRAELSLNENTLDSLRSLTVRHDAAIAALEEELARIHSQRGALTGRQQQLELAIHEIDGEVEVLAANVQASEVLQRFCGQKECRLFQSDSISYGRTLLFLRDQMKDLRAADGTLAMELSAIAEREAAVDAEIARARQRREEAVKASPLARVYGGLETVTKALVEVELQISKAKQLELELARFERSLEERDQQIRLVESLKPRGERRDESAVKDARRTLEQSMGEWLETLRTPNLPREVAIDDDFDLVIREEVFSRDSSISGSTRTRVVLAFHAALLEVAISLGGNHPGWLLLDAPKQHELSQSDLNAFLRRLSDIARKAKLQVVFSIANADVPLGANDVLWTPTNGKGRDAKFLFSATTPRG